MDEPIDCLVVGAGPAGLTAAIYLARFLLSVRVIDAGKSRASWIPRTRNHAGYPGGIPGTELLAKMREQAAEFGVTVTDGLVERVTREGETFVASVAGGTIRARTVLLATGVVNNRPSMSPEIHDVALGRGLLRYCPICDGYEVTDKVVGVIGTHEHGMNEAVFIRMYTPHVTLISPHAKHELSDEQRARLAGLGIEIVAGPCHAIHIDGDHIVVPVPGGDRRFDSIYPALGSVIRSELAVELGAGATDDGCLAVDDHQRTSIPGLYAAGDVARGLDQISHAMGEAGVAATTIRNDLAKVRVLAR
ncbi:MAG: NAD(P)/FAD-dependent oxidoreductase [Janthinobacterium lividum]